MSRIFSAVSQNGYVVRDIHAAREHWVNLMGVGPWHLFENIVVERIQPTNEALSMYRDFLAAGRLRMPVDQVFPFEAFAVAFERMAQNRHFGKIVLSLP